MKYRVWYAKSYHPVRDGIDMGKYRPYTYKDLITHYRFVREVEAEGLNEVFSKMQGENWSPKGEARFLIRSLGLKHTSMITGDLVQGIFIDAEGNEATDAWHRCDWVDWTSFVLDDDLDPRPTIPLNLPRMG